MRTIDAIEYGSIDVPITELLDSSGRIDIHSSLLGRDFIDIRLKRKTNSLQIFAGSYVGVIPLNSTLAIKVNARAPLGNLTRILHIADYVPVALDQFARDYVTTDEDMPDLFEIYARSLVALVEPLRAFGLMRDYARLSLTTNVPRGRITLSAKSTQLALIGASSRVESSWFERSTDIAVNRCIKFALWLLAKRIDASHDRKGNRSAIRALNSAYRLFDGVQLESRLPLGFLSDPLVTGVRGLPSSRIYYRDALRLSAMVATGLNVALDRPGADLRTMPLLLKMDDVFESYVRAVLRRHEPFIGGELRVLDGNLEEGKKLLFDEEPSSDAKPDIVVSDGYLAMGRALLVADVKYKPASGPRPDRSDLNQVITYGATYRAPKALIIQPRGPKSKHVGLKFLGRISELQIFQFVFDLSAESLIEEEQKFVDAVAGLLGGKPEEAGSA